MKKISMKLSLAAICSVLSIGGLLSNSKSEEVFAEDESVKYEDSFDYPAFSAEEIFDGNIWEAENPNSGNQASFSASKPDVSGGSMNFVEGMSAQFNWINLEGFSFDSTKTYTFSFEVKVTSFGDNVGIRDVWKRELYVGVGGYYNQVEFRNDMGANKVFRAGDSWAGNEGNEYKENVTYTVIIEWTPAQNKYTSTIKNGADVVVTGSRTNSAYAALNTQTSDLVMRCEEGAISIDNFSFTDGSNSYQQTFEEAGQGDGYMVSSGIWALESIEKSGTAPTIVDGKLNFVSKNSIAFNWTKVPGVGEFNREMSYSFEFDFKVTDLGDGSNMGVSDQTRVLYMAMGGYYNQVEMLTANNRVRAGDTYKSFDNSSYFNKDLHVEMIWEGTSITSTIYDQSRKALITGSRFNSAFTNMSDHKACMTYLVFRCEDGAFIMDNFKFQSKKLEINDSQILPIEEGKAATYEADVNISGGAKATIKLNGVDLLSLSGGSLKLCGSLVNGTYNDGKYHFKATINIEQKRALVELTLPDGGIIRRGTHAILDLTAPSQRIEVIGGDGVEISNAKVDTFDIEVREYFLLNVEPIYSGIDANIYNIVTSFDDPATTRRFAWTALQSFVSNKAMVVKYKAFGEANWKSVEAIKEIETVNTKEDYFKANVSGLKPNTSYEYKIGIKDSSEDQSNWSEGHVFQTAARDIDEFKFIAVGDTQGITWNGTSTGNKGFMYAKAAFDMASEEVSDAAFILNAGDIVENGDNNNQWNLYFKALGELGASIPHFAAIGNHDTVKLPGSQAEFYFDLHFNHPKNGGTAMLDPTYVNKMSNANMKAIAQDADETFYSYDYGDAHFIVLNSGHYTSDDYYLLEAQREWLRNDLEANKNARWKIIMVHEPVYHRLGGNESRPWLHDVIEEEGVDLLIQGHSHLVTRTYPMKDGKIVSKKNVDIIEKGSGTVYTTLGSTTLNHDSPGNTNVEECMFIETPSMEQATYTTVEVKKDSLIMTIKQLNGLVVDRFEIKGEASQGDDGEEKPNPDKNKGNKKNNAGLIAGISIGSVALVGAIAAVVVILIKKKKH